MAGNYIGSLVYRITGDTSGIEKSLSHAKGQTEGFASYLPGWVGKVAGLFAGAFAVGKIIDFDKKLLGVASHANEVSSRFGNTFAGAIDNANKSVKELTSSYGFSTTAAQSVMSATGGLVETLGATDTQAEEMSSTVAKLGADMASYVDYAGGAEGASDALTKALLGETDSAKGLSLSLGDEALTTYAASMGKALDACTPLEKAQLRLNLALTQASAMGAVGDMVRTASGYANTLRAVESKMEDAEARAGQALIPNVTKLAKEFGDAVAPGGAFAGMLDTVAEAGAQTTGILSTLLAKLNAASRASSAVSDRRELGIQQSVLTAVTAQINAFGGLDAAKRKASSGDVGAADAVSRYERVTKRVKDLTDELKQFEEQDKQARREQDLDSAANYQKLMDDAYNRAEIARKDLAENGAKYPEMGRESLQKTYEQNMRDYEQYLKKLEDLSKRESLTTNDIYADKGPSVKKHTVAASGPKPSDSIKNAADARAAIQALDSEMLNLGVSIADMSDKDLAALVANLSQSNPAVQAFVQAFGGLANVRSMLKDVNDDQMSSQDLAMKWKEALDKVGKAAADIKIDPSAKEQIDNAKKATEDWNNTIAESNESIQRWGNAGLNALGSMSNAMSSFYDAKLKGIDASMQAELQALGLADESESAKAEREYSLAKKSGDKTLIAEKKKALEKEKIEEKYAKKKADLEYKAAMMQWGFQVAQAGAQIPMAISSALASASAWKMGPASAALYAAIAGASATAAEIAVIASKPKRSNYSTGGVVPGSLYTGDKIPINVNSGERILTAEQNRSLEKIANSSPGVGQTMQVVVPVTIGTTKIAEEITNLFYNGQAWVPQTAVSAR